MRSRANPNAFARTTIGTGRVRNSSVLSWTMHRLPGQMVPARSAPSCAKWYRPAAAMRRITFSILFRSNMSMYMCTCLHLCIGSVQHRDAHTHTHTYRSLYMSTLGTADPVDPGWIPVVCLRQNGPAWSCVSRCEETIPWRHVSSLQMESFIRVLLVAKMPNVSGNIRLPRTPRCLAQGLGEALDLRG